jgi:hypothetical protein
LDKLLAFLYTDSMDDVDADADLFVAAEKFDVAPLRRRCEDNLCSKLNVSNAAGESRSQSYDRELQRQRCKNLQRC